MPELPEVETVCRGIRPWLEGRRIEAVVVRTPRLRLPLDPALSTLLPGRQVQAVERRAKYILVRLEGGTLILHLGMSGSLRVLPLDTPPGAHDHLDLVLADRVVRLRDPRRFGLAVWHPGEGEGHPLLARLGPEPLGPDFDGAYLHRLSRGRRGAVKGFLMDQQVVVGVGNIYASEALFRAGIHPRRAAGRIALERYRGLADAVVQVLRHAIAQGGTTLRDFIREDGAPGYFAIALQVYGRADEPCPRCATPLRNETIGQRSSYFCPHCQT